MSFGLTDSRPSNMTMISPISPLKLTIPHQQQSVNNDVHSESNTESAAARSSSPSTHTNIDDDRMGAHSNDLPLDLSAKRPRTVAAALTKPPTQQQQPQQIQQQQATSTARFSVIRAVTPSPMPPKQQLQSALYISTTDNDQETSTAPTMVPLLSHKRMLQQTLLTPMMSLDDSSSGAINLSVNKGQRTDSGDYNKSLPECALPSLLTTDLFKQFTDGGHHHNEESAVDLADNSQATGSTNPAPNRMSYPREFKLMVIDYFYAHGQNKYRTCKEFQITKSMLNGWLAKVDKIKESRPGSLKSGRSGRRPQFPNIEKQLFALYKQHLLTAGQKIGNRWIRDTARALAQKQCSDEELSGMCQFSERWLSNFKKRYRINLSRDWINGNGNADASSTASSAASSSHAVHNVDTDGITTSTIPSSYADSHPLEHQTKSGLTAVVSGETESNSDDGLQLDSASDKSIARVSALTCRRTMSSSGTASSSYPTETSDTEEQSGPTDTGLTPTATAIVQPIAHYGINSDTLTQQIVKPIQSPSLNNLPTWLQSALQQRTFDKPPVVANHLFAPNTPLKHHQLPTQTAPMLPPPPVQQQQQPHMQNNNMQSVMPPNYEPGRRGRKVQFPQVERVLYDRLQLRQNAGHRVSNRWLQEQARSIAQQMCPEVLAEATKSARCMFSEHWLHNFKKRYNVCLKTQQQQQFGGDSMTPTTSMAQSSSSTKFVYHRQQNGNTTIGVMPLRPRAEHAVPSSAHVGIDYRPPQPQPSVLSHHNSQPNAVVNISPPIVVNQQPSIQQQQQQHQTTTTTTTADSNANMRQWLMQQALLNQASTFVAPLTQQGHHQQPNNNNNTDQQQQQSRSVVADANERLVQLYRSLITAQQRITNNNNNAQVMQQ